MTLADAEFDAGALRPSAARPRRELESERTHRVLNWLKMQPETYARKVHTGPMGEGGHPDIDGCQRGRAFKIEMKQPGHRPTPRQMAKLRSWRESGALVGWATDVDEVQAIMSHVDDLNWRNPLTGPGDGGPSQGRP